MSVTGRVTPLQASCFLKSGSATPFAWQYGKPKFAPGLARRFSSSCGPSSPAQSRPWSVNQSSFVFGCQSKPTEFRTPRATTSLPLPSGL